MTHFNNTTPVTSFGLQSNDWQALAVYMAQDTFYDEIAMELKAALRVEGPPTGSTVINITSAQLGQLFKLFQQVEMREGKEVYKPVRNRFKTALEAVQVTYPAITTFLADLAADEVTRENEMREIGRKWLRGRLG